MTRFDGTSARQLDLIDPQPAGLETPRPANRQAAIRPTFRLLKQDVYAELTRRRRRAQIAARHLIDEEKA